MQRNWLTVVMALAACGVGPALEPEVPDPDLARDGDSDGADFLIWQGTIGGSGGIIIYDIQNGFVYTGSSQQGNLLLNLHDNGIYNAANTTLLCRFDGQTLIDAATGRVLFTTDGKVIYQGDTRVLSFSFKKEKILEGSRRDAEVVGVASVDLSRVGVQRKLLIAALFSANCGAPTLDP